MCCSFILLHHKILFQLSLKSFALGEGTTTSLTNINGNRVHCHDFDDAKQCLAGYAESANGNPVVLWLGNSQVHAINQMKSGDQTAVPELFKKLSEERRYLMTFSQPNANLQEHFLLFNYLQVRLPVKTLIMPVVFDDMRETGVRASLVDVLNDNSVSARMAQSEIGQNLLADNGDQDAAGNDMTALEDTMQESSEKWLNEKMDYFQIWSERPALRGQFFLSLYKFRNKMLGINPSSIRKMLPGNYSLNRQALEAILNQTRELGIQVLVYVVPLRNDVPTPYNAKEYSNFKTEMQALSISRGAYFVDLENLVPAEYWGTKTSTTGGSEQELDFMHFESAGHQLLSKALYSELQLMNAAGKN